MTCVTSCVRTVPPPWTSSPLARERAPRASASYANGSSLGLRRSAWSHLALPPKHAGPCVTSPPARASWRGLLLRSSRRPVGSALSLLLRQEPLLSSTWPVLRVTP